MYPRALVDGCGLTPSHGRRFIGNDLNPEAVRLASDRLREFGASRVPEDVVKARRPDLVELMDSTR